jgi:antibiotic biosynthesis monooxygenase (ABM) superfamily enzyme
MTPPSHPVVPPPSKHQMALMIWVAVFPTLVALNVLLGGITRGLPVVVKTFLLATIAVPIVIYGLMPRLHHARAKLIGYQLKRRTQE